MSKSPYPFGGKDLTGAASAKPSSTVLRSGNRPCHVLARLGSIGSFPHAFTRRSSPPRAANSHSASVGRRFPAQRA